MSEEYTHALLNDITPNRATVIELLTPEQRDAHDWRLVYSLAPLEGDLPDVGERVWIDETSVTGRA